MSYYIGVKDENVYLANAASSDDAYRQIGLLLEIPAAEVEDVDLDHLFALPAKMPAKGKAIELHVPRPPA